MRAVFLTRRWVVVVAFAAVLLAASGSASAASDAPIWAQATVYGSWAPETAPGASPTTPFVGTSCASADDCVAVGAQGGDLADAFGIPTPVFAVESDGVWGAPTPVVISGLVTGELLSVSCPSSASCVAVGYYTTSAGQFALIVPISVSGSVGSAGAPVSLSMPSGAAANPQAELAGVSCAAGNCTAVGSYSDTGHAQHAIVAVENGDGTWTVKGPVAAPGATATAPAAASGIRLNAVSCPSTGACEAVGTYDDSSSNAYPWAVAVTGGVAGQAEPVAMPSDFVAGTTSAALDGLVLNALGSISCPSAGVCTAAGSYSYGADDEDSPVVVPITNGSPGTALTLTSTGPAIAGLSLTLVSGIFCSDASDCSVSGSSVLPTPTPLIGSETAGAWSVLSPLTLTPGSAGGLALSLSCASAGDCLMSGFQLELVGVSGEVSTFFTNSAPPLSAPPASPAAATVGQPYTEALQVIGGSGDYDWSLAAGSLPAGLSLDPSTGVISGTPTTAGQDGFVAEVTSPSPTQTALIGVSINILPAATPVTGTPPIPTTKAIAAAIPTVAITRLTVSGAKAKVTLSCSGAPCPGALKVAGIEHLNGKTPTAVTANVKKKLKKTSKTITLATTRYSLAAGQSETVTLALTKTAAKLLTKLRKVHGELSATPTGAKQAAVIKPVTFNVKTKKKK
jgi:hypothetical protein